VEARLRLCQSGAGHGAWVVVGQGEAARDIVRQSAMRRGTLCVSRL
jgi:microcompartment protein CcmK/EutM